MRMPGAEWIGPTINRTAGGMGEIRGLVLHIQQGNEAGTEAWQHNASAQVSSHFLAPRAGGVRQMVDTTDKAWCQVAGNTHWLSVECEGRSGEPLTGAQVEACARILAWAHTVYRVALAPCNDPTAGSPGAGGLGYHAMGGRAWGGHFDCPGAPVIAQRDAIVTRATVIAGGTMVQPSSSLTPAEQKELADIAYTTEQVVMPDGTRAPLHVALTEVLKQLGEIRAALPVGTIILSGTVSGQLTTPAP